jgi:hypothetical protein
MSLKRRSNGVPYPFYLSPQVRLDVKLKVVKLVDPGATLRPFYVTAQAFSCGVPMHSVTCSTSEPTARESGMRTVWWGDWITLPVQYKDVDRGGYVVVKVWNEDNKEVGSTKIQFFDQNRCLKEGQHRLLLDLSDEAAEAAARRISASDSHTHSMQRGDRVGTGAGSVSLAPAEEAPPLMDEASAELEMTEWVRLLRLKGI